MPKIKNPATISTLPKGDYVDGLVPGLNLTVGAKRRTWTLRHRVGGRLRRDRLGHFPAMGLAQARDAARELALRVDHGLMPTPPPVHPRDAGITVGDMLDRYERFRRQKGERVKTLDKKMVFIRNHLRAHLAVPLTLFGKHELREIRDRIAATAPASSNQFLACLAPAFRWALTEDLVEHDVSRGVLKVAPVVKRDRVLSHEELRRIWHAAGEMGPSPTRKAYGRLIKFLMLVGCRLNEAGTMRYGDILDGVWRQDPRSNKSNRLHTVPLSALAMSIVGTGEARDLVFASSAGTKLLTGQYGPLKRHIDQLCGVEAWVHHDLRRTFASALQDFGTDYLTIEALLNHSLRGTASVYMRGTMEAQKREALASWAVRLEQIVGVRPLTLVSSA